MRLSRHLRIPALITGLLLAMPAVGELRFHFEDRFSAAERARITGWVRETVEALASLVGAFPFDVHVHLYRRDGVDQPVPWAHTRRGPVQGVHLHIDPRFSPEDFRRDWTAPHEFGHLVLPYLGSAHAWFAEGFASYLQYQVMIAMGVLTQAEANARYRQRIASARQRYRHPTRSFAAAAPRLWQERNYPTLYWGGAVYFLNADAALQQGEHAGLIELLREYLKCCRSGYGTPRQLALEFDRLSGTRIFTTELDRFEGSAGFPARLP